MRLCLSVLLSVKTTVGVAPMCFSLSKHCHDFGVHLILTPLLMSLHPFKPETEGEIVDYKNIILDKNVPLCRQLCSS